MIDSERPKYLEWLNTIANARLIFNTLDELEDYLDNHNIRTNGVKRCYNTEQKARAAFADVCLYVGETAKMTSSGFCIMMEYYKQTSEYYRTKLSRKKDQEEIIRTILRNYFLEPKSRNCTPSMQIILDELVDKDIDIPILVLLLSKGWSGYDSKDGDVPNFMQTYNQVIQILSEYAEECACIQPFPPVIAAKKEANKSRLTLAVHVRNIIEKIREFNSPDAIFQTVHKEKNLDLNIEGYWNECGGKAERTDFWHIERTPNIGLYYAIRYDKKEGGKVERTRYSIDFAEDDYGNVTVLIVHPKAGRHYFEDYEYDESEHCYYKMAMPDNLSNVDVLNMTEVLNFPSWPKKLNLTRITDKKLIDYCDGLLENCQIINKYKKWETEFVKCLYAITDKFLYIKSDIEGKFYKVPTDIMDSLNQVDMDSRIGLLKVGNIEFIALDDFNVYIPIKEIKEFGIEVVERVE